MGAEEIVRDLLQESEINQSLLIEKQLLRYAADRHDDDAFVRDMLNTVLLLQRWRAAVTEYDTKIRSLQQDAAPSSVKTDVKTESDDVCVEVGSCWKHKKRGAEYIVVGNAVANDYFGDDELVDVYFYGTGDRFIKRHTDSVPVSLVVDLKRVVFAITQVSVPNFKDKHRHMVVYTDGEKHWVRYTAEFLDGRFEQVTNNIGSVPSSDLKNNCPTELDTNVNLSSNILVHDTVLL